MRPAPAKGGLGLEDLGREPSVQSPEGEELVGGRSSLVKRLGVAACGGVLVAFSLPPWGWWFLAPIGLAGVFVCLWDAPLRWRALIGFSAGLGQFLISLWWALKFTGVGYGVLVVFESAYPALACAAVPPRRGRSLAFPACIMLAEALRDSWPLGGLPIGSIEYGQALGPLLGSARIVGALGLAGLSACAAVVLAHLAVAAISTARGRAHKGLGAAFAGAAVVVGLPLAAMATPAGGPQVGNIRVAAVQGGGPRGFTALQTNQRGVYKRQYQPTKALSSQYDLVLWPEDVIALSGPLSSSPVKSQMSALARRLHTTIVAGVTELVGESRFRNMVVAWGPSGQIVGSYEKVHRVPFGEYVPWRSELQGLFNFAAVPRDAIPGKGPGFLRTPAGPLGIMISYEDLFSGRARAAVTAGAEVLLVPTNTASYATRQIPSQELAGSRLRAVEAGRWLVQASPTGYSGVVSPSGTVSDRTALGAPSVVSATVPLKRGTTPFERFGEVPDLAIAGSAVLFAFALAFSDLRLRATKGKLPTRNAQS